MLVELGYLLVREDFELNCLIKTNQTKVWLQCKPAKPIFWFLFYMCYFHTRRRKRVDCDLPGI